MSHLNYLGGIKREIHQIKVMGDFDREEYQPSIVLTRPTLPGRSFIIPLEAFWKYIDPSENNDEIIRMQDRIEFEKIKSRLPDMARVAVLPHHKARIAQEAAVCAVAEMFARGMRLTLITSYNLAKCMQLLEITVCPQSAAQLLMFIQDGLEDMKNCPEEAEEAKMNCGEVTMTINGESFTRPLTVGESEMVQ